jgi:hypothetical protein
VNSDDDNKVILTEIDDVLANPFKGFAPWIGSNNPIYEAKLQQATFTWSELEPQQGNYNWSRLERNWGNVANTGKRVGFRVTAALPGTAGHIDIPQWLADTGIKMRTYLIDGAQGLAPDWDDPNFLQAHHDFIMALGNRYDQDPRVAWIDIGSYGFWGEWHVWLNDTLAATEATKKAILDDYFEAFPTKAKVIAFDDDFATEYVTDRGGGIRNDCLGTSDSNNWYLTSLNRIDPTLNDRVWKNAIITGEFCGSDWGAMQGTTVRFDLNYEFVKSTHWSFIGSAGGAINPENEEHRQNLDQLHKTLGYRYVLKTVSMPESANPGTTLSVSITVENKGIAPFYFDWPLVLYIVDDTDAAVFQTEVAIDIRNWLPGTNQDAANIDLPANLPSGKYKVKFAIHDPDTDVPGVLFANEGKDDSDRYLVANLTVN